MIKYQFYVGQRVRWEDPDNGICSCAGTIVEISCLDDFITDGDIIIIRQDSGGIVEALPCELSEI